MSKEQYDKVLDDPKSGYQEMFEAAVDYLEELETQECENCAALEFDVDRLRESEKFFAEKCGDLETQIEVVKDVGFETHPSWGCSKEFNDGWKACREQVQEAIE